jgi:RNA polymerase sigma-70 factor, ECF subfamily
MKQIHLAKLLTPMLPRLWTFALRLSRDCDDASYLVQRACLRALESAHDLKSCISPRNWMFKLIYDVWFHELRGASNRRSQTVLDYTLVETGVDPHDQASERRVTAAQIVAAMMELPDEERAIMLLIAVEDLSYDEASNVLQLPTREVVSRLSRARQMLGGRLYAVNVLGGRDQVRQLMRDGTTRGTDAGDRELLG